MIRIKNLEFTFPGTKIPALQIDDLDIEAGTFNLIIGQSGSGKSTLLRLINGLVPHFSGGELGGRILVAGLNPVQVGPQRMSKEVGFVFQEVENQFVVDRVEDEIAFSMEQAAIPRAEMEKRQQWILEKLEINHLKTRNVDSLSGGEMQKIAIAGALVLEPRILVLDEPTSQLDPQAAEEVMQLLKRLQQDLGLTIILSEQRLDRVLSYADQVIILTPDGQLQRSGKPQDVISDCLLKPPVVQLAEQYSWQPIPLDVDQARFFIKQQPKSPYREKFEISPPNPLLQVQHLYVHVGSRQVLHDIDFKLFSQDRLVVMGPNGAGKSTLLRSLVGLVNPDSGEILLKGKQIKYQHTYEVSKTVGYLPQDPNALLFSESVQEELSITLRNHQMPVQEETIFHLLAQLNLVGKAQSYPRDLSTGEKQRVALGAVVVMQPELIILDEPTRGLDQIAKQALIDLLMDWNKEGKTILMVTHDVEFAAAFASRIILLEEGKIVDQGDPRRIMHTYLRYGPQIARLYPQTDWLTIHDLK